MVMDFSARVEIGVKETNDDRCLIGGKIIDNAAFSCEQTLPSYAVVCDGCGGYLYGNVAAQTALETFSEAGAEDVLKAGFLQNVLEKCNRAIFEKKSASPEFSEMCTTIVGCVFGERSINIFHSGDSRVYRFDGRILAKMTADHSAVQQLIDFGSLTPRETEKYQKNVITRCLGAECLPPEIYVVNSHVLPGEKYILCSDGLWEWVSDDEMKAILSKKIPVSEMADELVKKALANGSNDNITACLCSARGEFKISERKPFVLE